MADDANAAAPAAADPDTLNLRVQNQDGSEVVFKIKKHTSLKKLMDAYCSRQGQDANSVRFLFNGNRLQPDQTPKELDMEDNDVIDVVISQTGGL